MSLFKSKSKSASDKTVNELKNQLEEKGKAAKDSKTKLDKSQTALDEAYTTGEPTTALEKQRNDDRTEHERNVEAYNAIDKKLNDARQAAQDAEHQAKLDQLEAALKQRMEIARKLEQNAKERAAQLDAWAGTDRTLAELRSAHIVSDTNATLMALPKFQNYLVREDGRHGVPGADPRWHPSKNPTDPRSSLVEQVDYINATIREGARDR